jgi:hypothetical protein
LQPSRMTGLIRVETPDPAATVTNLTTVSPLMTETDPELQGLLPQ